MNSFASLGDVMAITGKEYTVTEQERIETLLPLVSDALRVEGIKVGRDLDQMAENNSAYANLLKLVTVDIIVRGVRQDTEGEPMSQESQSALGYSWSGTYAVPGGGIAAAIMRNDLKRLGLRRPTYGAMEIYEKAKWNHDNTSCETADWKRQPW